jgi:hypothetical protein
LSVDHAHELMRSLRSRSSRDLDADSILVSVLHGLSVESTLATAGNGHRVHETRFHRPIVTVANVQELTDSHVDRGRRVHPGPPRNACAAMNALRTAA